MVNNYTLTGRPNRAETLAKLKGPLPGDTFIPLNFNLPSKAVRQGRPGGTLAIRTRWLALAGTGGRMGLGFHWHRTF